MSGAVTPSKSKDTAASISTGRPSVKLENETDKSQCKWLDSLYRAHWNDLVCWLRRKFGAGPPAPEDIAQTTFTKLAAMESILSVQHPKSYLYAIAVNVARDEIHWLRRTNDFVARELKGSGYMLEEITPERVCTGKQELDRVVEAMNELSEKQRVILERSRLLGQTYAQISAETGWSNADISRQLSDAILRLSVAVDRGRGRSSRKRKKVQ